MVLDFREATCPVCAGRGERSVLTEIATGLVRTKCPRCKRRVWVSSDGHEVRVGMVDAPAKVIARGQRC